MDIDRLQAASARLIEELQREQGDPARGLVAGADESGLGPGREAGGGQLAHGIKAERAGPDDLDQRLCRYSGEQVLIRHALIDAAGKREQDGQIVKAADEVAEEAQ